MEHENNKFEQNLNQEERAIDLLLRNAMHIPIPDGLADRIASASVHPLLEGQLVNALSIETPEGLASRVFVASVSSLKEPEVIVGRIGAWWRWFHT